MIKHTYLLIFVAFISLTTTIGCEPSANISESCSINNGGCFQTCTSLKGGAVQCGCVRGSTLRDDGKSCMQTQLSDSCATAVALRVPGKTRIQGTTTVATNSWDGPLKWAFENGEIVEKYRNAGPDVYYTFHIPEGGAYVDVRRAKVSEFAGNIYLKTNCDVNDDGTELSLNSYTFLQPGQYILVVDSASEAEAGPFDFIVEFGDSCGNGVCYSSWENTSNCPEDCGVGDHSCEDAIPIETNSVVWGNTCDAGNDWVSANQNGLGEDVFFKFEITEPNTLVTISQHFFNSGYSEPDPNYYEFTHGYFEYTGWWQQNPWLIQVFLLDSCDSTQRFAMDTFDLMVNSDNCLFLDPGTYYLAVDGRDMDNCGEFSIKLNISVPANTSDDPIPETCYRVCGNGVCDVGENQETCGIDCGFYAGDGICGTIIGETRANTPEDCSNVCGDSYCDTEEQCDTCVEDCGYCLPENNQCENATELTLNFQNNKVTIEGSGVMAGATDTLSAGDALDAPEIFYKFTVPQPYAVEFNSCSITQAAEIDSMYPYCQGVIGWDCTYYTPCSECNTLNDPILLLKSCDDTSPQKLMSSVLPPGTWYIAVEGEMHSKGEKCMVTDAGWGWCGDAQFDWENYTFDFEISGDVLTSK